MLYNWAAVSTGKLCPCGWHVPTDAEWTTLIVYLGGAWEAGGKMKARSGWSSPNTGATNSSGFTGFPGGVGYDDYRSTYPVFSLFGYYGSWWSNTESASVLNNRAKIISLGYDTADAMQTIRINPLDPAVCAVSSVSTREQKQCRMALSFQGCAPSHT